MPVQGSAGAPEPSCAEARSTAVGQVDETVRVMDYEYRERGTNCLRVANEIENPRHRAFLIEMGHAWMRLHEQAGEERPSRPDPRQPAASAKWA
jgi:hypothetical protein